eukprot:NODE_2383_length_1192_cov_35.286385_g2269_i0.p1 GENE.NODE_2383_length_1192_cov_35.286385_g2269_i0~~NODE_2383_length_1192_cov_35.286385_g2269_i0.p1  ORF type:complete len:282 (-),score=60.78 NODE_2383_length_1192_cov_35.286385_g2269_i0:257-1102(-)
MLDPKPCEPMTPPPPPPVPQLFQSPSLTRQQKKARQERLKQLRLAREEEERRDTQQQLAAARERQNERVREADLLTRQSGVKSIFELWESTEDRSSHYLIQELLGQGSYGKVFRVTDRLNKTYAMKQVLIQIPKDDDRQLYLFQYLLEAEVLRMLQHPLICGIHDWFRRVVTLSEKVQEEYLVIIMEFCSCSLAEKIAQQSALHQPFAEAAIFNLLKMILQAMAYIHSVPIIHRDIKAENICFVESEACIRVCDFGGSRCAVEARTLTGQEDYLAPALGRS